MIENTTSHISIKTIKSCQDVQKNKTKKSTKILKKVLTLYFSCGIIKKYRARDEIKISKTNELVRAITL